MAIAAYREPAPALRHGGFAYGIPDPRATVTEPPRPAERVIEGEVIDRTRWRGTLTTRDYLQLRALQKTGDNMPRSGTIVPDWFSHSPQVRAQGTVLDFYA